MSKGRGFLVGDMPGIYLVQTVAEIPIVRQEAVAGFGNFATVGLSPRGRNVSGRIAAAVGEPTKGKRQSEDK